MHHSIQNVASARFLNYKKLSEFSLREDVKAKFCISGTVEPVVSSWHVDELVNAYKDTQTKADLELDRKLEIVKLKS
ncbi:hypothetical protein [Reinekea sp. G2M2-21]|uniref:hypothetical protein n=1 Tax=Reinekea sp. G2M2-21 TaxID=2788942 RepID=UPI0018AAEF85|nr:hypothetical protein [Reinekea sp. G2M2-21]